LFAFEDSSGVNAGLGRDSEIVNPITDQTACLDETPQLIDRRNGMTRCQGRKLVAPTGDKRIAGDNKPVSMQLERVANAESISPSGVAFTIASRTPFARAASSKFLISGSLCVVGLVGFTSRAMTLACGTSSDSSSSRLGVSWLAMLLKPVTLPPGRTRLT